MEKNLSSFLLFALLVVLLGQLVSLINLYVLYHFVFDNYHPNVNNQKDAILNIGFFGAVIAMPIIEEMVIRWPYLLLVKKLANPTRLAIVFSLVFAFLHHAEVFLAAFGLSLFFCYLVAKTQSIKISILAHILNNFSVYLLVTYFSEMIDEIYFNFIKSAFVLGVALSGFIIILAVWLIHGGRLKMIVTTIERALMGLQKRVMKTLWQVNNKI